MRRRAHGGRQRAVRAAVLLVVLAAATACADGTDRATPTTTQPVAAAAHPATDVLGEQVVRPTILVTPYERQAFLELAMEPAVAIGRPAVLERWRRDPTFAITGTPTPDDLRRFVEAIQRWGAITGRRLVLTEGDADVVVHFVPRDRFAAVLSVDHVDPTAVGLTRVSFRPGHRGEITGAVVVVASDDDQVARNRTIAHEVGHTMGLQHSTCPSSLMDGSSDGERSVRWSPSPLDERMGALLYDARLAPGLGRATIETMLVPAATTGATCGPVDLALVRAAGSGRHYFCARSEARVQPCTSDTSTEPRLPIVNPDAWTDGTTLSARPPG